MNWLNKNYNVISFLLLVTVAASYLFFCVFLLLRTGYLPFNEDETIFYNSGRLFFETGSLKGESGIEENFSIIFQANWYGIAYNIIYGGIAKLFGFNNFYFVYLNILLVVFSLFILLKINKEKIGKVNLVVFFLLFNMVFSYTFTYFPEVIHIFFGVCLSYLLIRIYEDHAAIKPSRFTILYVILCLFFSFFRVTWVFWIIGMLPFASGRTKIIGWVVLFFASTALAFLYVQYFCAPPYVVGGSILNELKEVHLWKFISGVFINIVRNGYYFLLLQFKVEWSWMFIKLFYVFISSYLFYSILKGQNKLIQAVGFIFLLNILVIFSLYIAVYPYLMKITSSLFILFFISVIYLDIRNVKYVTLAVLLISFPFVLKETYTTIKQRENTYILSRYSYFNQVLNLKKIASLVEQNKESMIQRGYYDMGSLPKGIFYSSLPVSNNAGFPIRYTDCMLKDSMPYEDNFKSFNKINIDYVMSGKELKREDVLLMYQSENFYFYKKIISL